MTTLDLIINLHIQNSIYVHVSLGPHRPTYKDHVLPHTRVMSSHSKDPPLPSRPSQFLDFSHFKEVNIRHIVALRHHVTVTSGHKRSQQGQKIKHLSPLWVTKRLR